MAQRTDGVIDERRSTGVATGIGGVIEDAPVSTKLSALLCEKIAFFSNGEPEGHD